MKRLWPTALAGLALVTIALLVAGTDRGAGPSVLARGADGWLGARRYLEARGASLELLDQPVEDAGLAARSPGATLVTTFPWATTLQPPELDAYRGFVRQGGRLIVGVSGEAGSANERKLLLALGAPLRKVRAEPPLLPLAWRRHQTEQWALLATGGREIARLPAPGHLPTPPAGAQVVASFHTTSGKREAAVFEWALGAGRVLVLPSQLFANARLAAPGSADLLEQVLAWSGEAWLVDERVHGLAPPPGAAEAASTRAFDLFVLHIALLYGLGLWALARRFGPAWPEPLVRAGSATRFLLGLGALHHRLGHHASAARRLLDRLRELEPRRFGPGAEHDVAPLAARADAADAAGLLALARELALARSWSRLPTPRRKENHV